MRWIKYLFTFLIISLTLIFWGCSERNNMPPVLLDVVEDVSVVKDDSLVIKLSHISGYDEDGDEFSIVLHDGDNYIITGKTVIPDSGFIGDLFVLLHLTDGKDVSNSDTMIISVVNVIVVQPLYDSSWWSYNDSAYGSDSVLASKLVVKDNTFAIQIDSIMTTSANILAWSNLEEYDINYLVGNGVDGQYQYGVFTLLDTIIKQQLQHMYPCSLNATWPFTLIKYNVTDNLLFEDTTVTMTCTDTAAYITVPAGTFKCVEYTFLYNLPEQRGTETSVVVTPLNIRAVNRSGIITEKIYYADGVGYIQNTTYSNGTLIWKKVLIDYYVEEVEEL